MLDVVLPLSVALLGAVIAALPLYAAKRGARVPSGIRIAGVFFAIWGVRDLAYGLSEHAAVLVAAGASALVAGVWVVTLTFSSRNSVPRGLGPAILGAAHLALTLANTFL